MEYSFCVITDGKEIPKTLKLMQSIREQNVEHELLVAGLVPAALQLAADKTVMMPEEARLGRLGAMRNALCREAIGNILVVLDDDMYLADDFCEGMTKYGSDFDVLSCRILNPDGSRYWDWKRCTNGLNELVDYDKTHPDQSLTGGLCIMHNYVFAEVQWDDKRGFYQEEDVDFSQRLKAAGYRLAFNIYSTVVHDANYYQVGNVVMKR